MQVIATLSFWVAAVLALAEAFGKFHYPVHWGENTFDGALAVVAAICVAHGVRALRRRGSMSGMRFGSSH